MHNLKPQSQKERQMQQEQDNAMTLPKLTFEILGGVVRWLVAKI